MAIKTKKISELNSIPLSEKTPNEDGLTSLDSPTLYLLACQDTITGKLSTKDIIDTVRNVAAHVVDTKVSKDALVNTPAPASLIEIDEIKSANEATSASVIALTQKVDDMSNRYKKLAYDVTKKYDELQETTVVLSEKIESSTPSVTSTASCDCAEKIAALEAKVAALEGFVQALQAEGYLTLANIKKAAAEACPICTHTHEETAE